MAQKFISFHNVADGVLNSDGINLGQLLGATAGSAYYQKPVISQINLVTGEPVTPSIGDRYINEATGTSNVTSQPVTEDYIYEWDGSVWTETVIDATLEGAIAYDNSTGEYYSFNGTDWVLLISNPQYVTDYFVSSDIGNDSNTGLFENTAFATLDAALNAAKIAAVPFAIHILDSNTYTVTGDGGGATRNVGVGFSISFPHATIEGQAGGVTWIINDCTFEGLRLEGTNLTFQGDTTGTTFRNNFNVTEIDNPSYMWTLPVSGAAGNMAVLAHRIVGVGGIADYSGSASGLFAIKVVNNITTISSDSSRLYDFKVNGGSSVVWFSSSNYDSRNNGTGDFVPVLVTGGGRAYIDIQCIGSVVAFGAECDAASNVYARISSATNGQPLPYTGAGANKVHDYSWEQGMNFDKLAAMTALDLSDIVNVRDVSAGEQKKATLAQIQAAIGGSSGLVSKSGIVASGSFTGSPKKAAVVFATAFTDNLYSVTITGEDVRMWSIESKTASGFTINANSSSGLTGGTFWQAIKTGETA